LATLLADSRKQADRSLNAHRNLIIVRLACGSGLRVSEIGEVRAAAGYSNVAITSGYLQVAADERLGELFGNGR
jgi:hypothetical protein